VVDPKRVHDLLETDVSQFAYIKHFETFPWAGHRSATCLYQLATNEIDRDFGKRIDEQTVGGYLGSGTFQHKTYDQTLERLISDYDYRPTLYWNPDFVLQQQEQSLTFYNNSRAKGYWITIQGVTQSGKLVFYQKKYFN